MRTCRPSLRASLCTVLLAFGLVGFGAFTLPDEVIRVGHFSAGEIERGFPAGWQPLTFGDIDTPTTYTVRRVNDTLVVKAESNSGASGLVTERRINPNTHPVVAWRWKVSNVLEDGSVYARSGDDYPARLYLTFDYDRSNLSFGQRARLRTASVLGYDNLPTRALSYIWANEAPVGEPVENPYTGLVMMLPTQSGGERAGQWVEEVRHLQHDYRHAFADAEGTLPMVNGVALMTDTDDTGEAATAYYGDILFMTEAAAAERYGASVLANLQGGRTDSLDR